jgi:autotransporter-associated beta strand protein
MKTSKLTFQSTVFGLQPVKILAGFAAMFLMAGVGNAEPFYIYPAGSTGGTFDWSNTTNLWSTSRTTHVLASGIPAPDESVYASYYTDVGHPITINIDVNPADPFNLRSFYRSNETQPGNQVTFQPTGDDRTITVTNVIGGQGDSTGGGPMILQSTASHKLSVSAGSIAQYGADLYLGGTTADSALDEVITTNTSASSIVWRPVYLNADSVEIKNTVNMGGNGATLKGDLYLHNNAGASEDKTIKISALTGTGDAAAQEAATIYASEAYEGATARQATMELTAASGTQTTLARLQDNPGGASTMTLRVTKTGGSTQVFESAYSDFTGGTDISAGTILVNNASGSGLGSGDVVVHNSGTLGGTGTIDADVIVNSGGTLSPGASIESFATGALAMNNGSTFAYEVDSGGALPVGADLQVVSGNLDLSGTVTLTLTDLAGSPSAFALNTTFTLINYSGDWNNGLFTYNSSQIADGGTFTAGLNTWQLDYAESAGGENFTDDYITGSFVNITAVPEPATWILLAAGLTTLVVFRRRSSRA